MGYLYRPRNLGGSSLFCFFGSSAAGAGVRALGTPAAAGAPPPQSSAGRLAKGRRALGFRV